MFYDSKGTLDPHCLLDCRVVVGDCIQHQTYQCKDGAMKTLILGSGVSGMVMGHLLKDDYLILEKNQDLRLDTGAPFYLHEPIEWLPLQWKTVDVHEAVWDGNAFYRQPTLGMLNSFARKITGKVIDTSLKFMDGRLKRGFFPESGNTSDIFVALHNSVKDRLQLNYEVSEIYPEEKILVAMNDNSPVNYKYDVLINTLPLPRLLSLLKKEHSFNFKADPVYIEIFKVPEEETIEVYQVVYIANRYSDAYRACLYNGTIYVEFMEPSKTASETVIEQIWGFKHCSKIFDGWLKPGKFHPVEKMRRKALLGELTSKWNIYCLGRYAVWDYKRLEHIAQDALDIQKIIQARSQS